jgi:hypothetical protein
VTDTNRDTPDLTRLAQASVALANLGRVLGLGQGLIAGESRDRLVCQAELESLSLAGVPAVAGPLVSLGSALHAEVRAGELPVLTITHQTAAPDVLAAQADLTGQRALLDLWVDKSVLRNELGLLHPDAEVALFLSPEALVRQLEKPLPELEQGVLRWESDARKLILVVAGCAVHLDGEHLAVVGSEAAPGWASVVPPKSPSDSRIRALREQAFQSASGPGAVNWLRFELKSLTPVHLALDPTRSDGTVGVGGLIRSRLRRVQALLGIVYTATQVTAPANPETGADRPAGEWMAIYAAEGKISRISWSDADLAAGGPAAADLEAGAGILGEMAQWAYSGERPSGDRLTVMRDVIVRSLMGNDPRDNYRLLVGQAAAFRDRLSSSWAAFMEGKLDKYFGHVHELEQVVDATVKAASEQVEGLTKTLIDSALAAVGVIVASFLAAVFKDKFDPLVYRLGVTAYVIYLVVFPCLIGLIASRQRFTTLVRALDERRQSFTHRLSEDEVNRTIGDAFTGVARRYRIWLWLASLVYAALAALLLWSSSAVPRLLTHGQSSKPAAQQAPVAR